MDLKPMGLGELIDRTFTLFRRAWKPLTILGLISIIPLFLIQSLSNTVATATQSNLWQNLIIGAIEQAQRGNPTAIISFFSAYALVFLVFLFLTPLWTGAFIAAAHQTVMGETVTLGSAFRAARSRYWALLGTSLLSALLYIVAFPVLVIGGLVILSPFTLIGGYLALMTFFAFKNQVIVIEREAGGVPAMKRSWNLVKGRFWPVLGTVLLFSLMLAMVGGILGLFINLPVQLLQTMLLKNEIGALLMSITQSLPQVIAAPLSALGITMLYYDTRIRKEGLDLEMAIQQPAPEYPQ